MEETTRHRDLTPEERRATDRFRELYNEAKKQGLVKSQEDLGEKMGGHSQGYIWQLLNYRLPVGMKAAIQAARILGCDPREISVAARQGLSEYAEIETGQHMSMQIADTPDDLRRYFPTADDRYIPLLQYKEAVQWRRAVDGFRRGAIRARLPLEPTLEASANAFALRIKGDAMETEYKEGDLIVVDPDAELRPGDIVVALDHESTTVVRRYRERGRDADGNFVYELKPLNDNHPVLEFRGDPAERIIGPVIEHRRRFRR